MSEDGDGVYQQPGQRWIQILPEACLRVFIPLVNVGRIPSCGFEWQLRFFPKIIEEFVHFPGWGQKAG